MLPLLRIVFIDVEYTNNSNRMFLEEMLLEKQRLLENEVATRSQCLVIAVASLGEVKLSQQAGY